MIEGVGKGYAGKKFFLNVRARVTPKLNLFRKMLLASVERKVSLGHLFFYALYFSREYLYKIWVGLFTTG